MTVRTDAASTSLSWVIRTKLGPPRAAFPAISRAALIGASAASACVTLLFAPPGFGKTTLMAELWTKLRSEGIRTPWVSLDEMDASAKGVLAYIAVSCLEAGASFGSLAQMAESGFSGVSPQELCALLINGLMENGQPTVLFLDDYHRVDSSEVDALLRVLIAKSPPCLKFVIGSRQVPNLGIAALRARGQLQELTHEQLRFSSCEIERFFGVQGLRPDIAEMKDKTEGWAVALQLAVPWLQQHPTPGEMARFSGKTEEIAAYLLEEVLNELPEEERHFLAQTSLLERVNGDLANAVTGRQDGWELLEKQHRRGLPMASLDGERNWFRYHHLLAEFLQEKLARLGPQRVEAVHRSAAEWLARHDYLHEAVAHARKIPYPRFAAELIERRGGWRLFLFLGVSGLRAFGDIPEVSPIDFPLTALGRALLKAVDGSVQQAREEFSRITQLLRSNDRLEAAFLDVSNVDFALQCYEDVLYDAAQVTHAEKVAQMPDVAPGMRVLTENFAVIAMTIWGDTRGALARSQGVIDRNRALDITYAELYLAIYQGLAQLRLGQLDAARELFSYISKRAREKFGPASNHAANGEIFLAWIDYLRGDHESTARLLGDKMQTIEYAEGTCDILLTAFEAGIALMRRRGDHAPVDELIERARQLGRRRGWPRMSGFAHCWRVRELIFRGDLEDAQLVDLTAHLTSQATRGQWSLDETGHVTLARLHVERGDPAGALTILTELEQKLRDRNHQIQLVDALILKAAALTQVGPASAAAATLQEAFQLAASCQLRSPLRDQGAKCRALLVRLNVDEEKRTPATPECRCEITERERDVLSAIANGLSNKEMATLFSISESTVKFHRKNLYRKLNVTTRSRAISTGRQFGLMNDVRREV